VFYCPEQATYRNQPCISTHNNNKSNDKNLSRPVRTLMSRYVPVSGSGTTCSLRI
jgi:hypothetical protein